MTLAVSAALLVLGALAALRLPRDMECPAPAAKPVTSGPGAELPSPRSASGSRTSADATV